jgi:hypothetical protein
MIVELYFAIPAIPAAIVLVARMFTFMLGKANTVSTANDDSAKSRTL